MVLVSKTHKDKFGLSLGSKFLSICLWMLFFLMTGYRFNSIEDRWIAQAAKLNTCREELEAIKRLVQWLEHKSGSSVLEDQFAAELVRLSESPITFAELQRIVSQLLPLRPPVNKGIKATMYAGKSNSTYTYNS